MPKTCLIVDLVHAADLRCCITASIVNAIMRTIATPDLRNPNRSGEVSLKFAAKSQMDL